MPHTAGSINNTASCTDAPLRQRLLLCLTRKTSHCFWFIIDLLSCKLDRFADLYDRSINKEYTREYNAVGLEKTHKVVHIGCGSYPLTDITLARMHHIRQITAIDNDPYAVALAQAVVTNKHLDNHIIVKHADGRTYPINDYDIIIISSCTWPTIEILEHIFTTAKHHSKIIIRELDIAIEPVIRCINTKKDIILLEGLRNHSFPFCHPLGWQTFIVQKQ